MCRSTFCGANLRKINACVSERNKRLYAVLNRLENSEDFHAMIREKFCIQSGAGLGVVQDNADKASCNASFLYTVYLVRSSQEHLESYSVHLPPNT